ncbi:MAG: hypothetical protein AAB036_11535 [Elusimicrobiota bacterium]
MRLFRDQLRSVTVFALLLGASGILAAEPDSSNLGPLVPHRTFSKDCGKCHVPKRWDVLLPEFRFDHLKETRYALRGAHVGLSCQQCHNDRSVVANYWARGCAACHADWHKSSMGSACAQCHDERSWKETGKLGQKRADHSRTRLPLTGMHAALQCSQCHTGATGEDFHGLSSDCISCHRDDFAGAKTTPASQHSANGFPPTCQNCHLTTSWGPQTAMKHSAAGSMACFNCHSADYRRAPNHGAQNYSQQCQSCHSTTSWLPRSAGGGAFDHATLGANPNCYGCHQASYQAAANHVAQNFSQNCQTCHSGTSSWLGAGFSHATLGANPNCYGCHQAAYTAAKITPASVHVPDFPQACQLCHNTVLWGPGTAMKHNLVSSVACYNCHQSSFLSAPNHVALNFSQTCQNCHSGTATWLGAAFDHRTLGANPDCYSCHTAAFASAKATPASNHTANGFPHTCQNCHSTTAWGPGTPMKHAFVGGMACYSCHAASFNSARATAASNHTANAFPTSSPACQTCHTTAASGFAVWSGVYMTGSATLHNVVGSLPCYNCHKAQYDSANVTLASRHAANGFPQSCQNCHSGFSAWGPGTAMKHNEVTSTPCYTCHAASFAAANVTPASKHVANSFPTTCQNCHSTTLWGPGTAMKHSYVGGTGAQCQVCHMAEFNAAVSPVNHLAQGFAPSACRQCHTNFTTWSSFVHNPAKCYNSVTKLSHENATCAQCHPGGNYSTASCTACHRNRGSCD